MQAGSGCSARGSRARRRAWRPGCGRRLGADSASERRSSGSSDVGDDVADPLVRGGGQAGAGVAAVLAQLALEQEFDVARSSAVIQPRSSSRSASGVDFLAAQAEQASAN